MSAAGIVASARRRTTGPVSTRISDDFSGTLAKWAGSTYGVSIVSGRLRIPCSNSFPQAQTAAVQSFTDGDQWIQVPTTPAPGNGTTQTHFYLESGANYVSFNISGSTFGLTMAGSGGIASTSITYSATAHLWLKFSLSGGNLLWQTSPDKVTWTTRKTVTAPGWLSGGLFAARLDSNFYGTETAPGYAEFDNYNV